MRGAAADRTTEAKLQGCQGSREQGGKVGSTKRLRAVSCAGWVWSGEELSPYIMETRVLMLTVALINELLCLGLTRLQCAQRSQNKGDVNSEEEDGPGKEE